MKSSRLPSGGGVIDRSAPEKMSPEKAAKLEKRQAYLEWRAQNPRSYAVYMILCLFFGTLGIHDMYAGRTLVGFCEFMLTFILTAVTLGTLGLGLIVLVPWCFLCIILGLVHRTDADGFPMR